MRLGFNGEKLVEFTTKYQDCPPTSLFKPPKANNLPHPERMRGHGKFGSNEDEDEVVPPRFVCPHQLGIIIRTPEHLKQIFNLLIENL